MIPQRVMMPQQKAMLAKRGDDTAQNQDGQDNAGSSTYVVDPNTGELIDPATGQPAEMDYGIEGMIPHRIHRILTRLSQISNHTLAYITP
ncbi:MAG: hypothetical protein ACLUGQ_08555 [Coprococcus sp.]